jgi:hypothetical protein
MATAAPASSSSRSCKADILNRLPVRILDNSVTMDAGSQRLNQSVSETSEEGGECSGREHAESLE